MGVHDKFKSALVRKKLFRTGEQERPPMEFNSDTERLAYRMSMWEEMKDHIMHGKMFKKLKDSEYKTCIDFIEETVTWDSEQMHFEVNRFVLDGRREMTKNWTAVVDLLGTLALKIKYHEEGKRL